MVRCGSSCLWHGAALCWTGCGPGEAGEPGAGLGESGLEVLAWGQRTGGEAAPGEAASHPPPPEARPIVG